MRTQNTDIPFSKEGALNALPMLVAVLIALVSLLLAFSSDLYGYVQSQASDQQRYGYVEVPNIADARDEQGAVIPAGLLLAQVTALLDGDTRIEQWRVIEEKEVSQLLSGWVGKGLPLDTLPLPRLIEFQWQAGEGVDEAASLQEQLRAIYPDIVLDIDQAWRGQFAQGGYFFIRILLGSAGLLLAGSVVMTVLFARMHFALHRDVLDLLRKLGATDRYITQQFQRHNMMIAMKGALAGSALAALLYIAWNIVDGAALLGLGNAVASHVGGYVMPIAIFAVMPCVMVVAVMIVTRMSMMRQLRHAY